ncbi:MAG TPA: metallophosphoesterase [Solirubrobacteraceae bacterium]|nr:metallophosphoesterase [Solirubrobacteraceae bacterium]
MSAHDDGPAAGPIRIAAAGDMHCHPQTRERTREAFARLDGEADLVLLAGDLTTHGEPEQAEVLAVLGNHDWHSNRAGELTAILEDAGVRMLDRDHATVCVGDVEVGVAGAKGFVGGFPGSHLPDFGEPLLREVYAETGRDVEALSAGLAAIRHCPVRIVLLHYAPIPGTLDGEPREIWTMLGSDRLAGPIAEHDPDLVLHGHAHHGTFEGRLEGVPVYNVAVPLMGRDFWVFEVEAVHRPLPVG